MLAGSECDQGDCGVIGDLSDPEYDDPRFGDDEVDDTEEIASSAISMTDAADEEVDIWKRSSGITTKPR